MDRISNNKHFYKGIIKKDYKEKGYCQIPLCKNGEQKMFKVHRLVAEAFIPNTENKPQIDHINTNRSNNRVYNLRWVTQSENMNNPLTLQRFKNKKLSEETKKKISEASKGEKHPMYGKHHTEETRQKISKSNKGRKRSEETKNKISEARKGKKNPGWKGGISPINIHLRDYIKPWKIYSMKHSNYKSVISKKPFKHIHHVNKNFSEILELTFKISNIEIKETIEEYTSEELEKLEKICLMLHYLFGPGVCLTEEEHKLFHSLYGKHDNTKEQFEEFKHRFQNGEFIE